MMAFEWDKLDENGLPLAELVLQSRCAPSPGGACMGLEPHRLPRMAKKLLRSLADEDEVLPPGEKATELMVTLFLFGWAFARGDPLPEGHHTHRIHTWIIFESGDSDTVLQSEQVSLTTARADTWLTVLRRNLKMPTARIEMRTWPLVFGLSQEGRLRQDLMTDLLSISGRGKLTRILMESSFKAGATAWRSEKLLETAVIV